MGILLLLAIIGSVVGIFAGLWALHQHSYRRFGHEIITICNMSAAFIGAIAFVCALVNYKHGDWLYMALSIVCWVCIYGYLCLRDALRSTKTIAFTALILRFAVSLILIAIIIWYFYIKGDPEERARRNYGR
jgi:hypothetical protein